jgi:hypothetical protein
MAVMDIPADHDAAIGRVLVVQGRSSRRTAFAIAPSVIARNPVRIIGLRCALRRSQP